MPDIKDSVATLARIAAQIQELQKGRERLRSEDQEKLDKLAADLNTAAKAVAEQNRHAEFNVVDVRSADLDRYNRDGVSLAELHQRSVPLHPVTKAPLTAEGAEVVAVQTALDHIYIISTLLKCHPTQTKYFQRCMKTMPLFAKAVGTPATEALRLDQWFPIGFSADLHMKVRLSLRVAALHRRIDMPTNPYKLPIEGADAAAYLVDEQTTADSDIATESTVGDNRVIANYMATTPTPGNTDMGMVNLTLTAKKVGARTTHPTEVTEESIIPILPYLRDKLAKAMRDVQEDATLNGDVLVGTSGAIDTDMKTASTKHRRAAWNGYRKLAIANCKVAAASATVLDVTDLRTLRMRMGKYAVDPSECVLVTGPVGYAKLLTLKDGSNPSPVMTIEKYGPQATLVTGEIARVDGMPIVLSEFVRENLNASGVHDGITTTRTEIFMVNRSQFIFGDFRQTTLKSREIIETDQTVLVTLQRLCFKPWSTTEPIVGFVYNIQNSFS